MIRYRSNQTPVPLNYKIVDELIIN
uniref:Uncharacterized protein n=1 Tax=Arundo donax TaxID=35708 RepID=A0A0A8Y9W0_ARUDO